MKIVNFPWEHYIDEENKEIWVHIPGGYPTCLGMPYAVQKFFPGYKGNLCTLNFLNALRENEQKTSC